MKINFFLALCLLNFCLNAQKNVDVSSGDVNPLSPSFFTVVGGEPFASARFSKLVAGSPYFNDDWTKGNVMLDEEKQYGGLYIKLDLLDNEVHYKSQSGTELIATIPIRKVILFDTVSGKTFSFVNGSFMDSKNSHPGWYQLLVNGQASLFKKIDKQLQENTPYGSATVEQSIYTSFHYFVLYNGSLQEIKKFRDLPGALSDKKEELTQYIKTKNLSGKTDDDFENLVNYFNTLLDGKTFHFHGDQAASMALQN